MYMSKSTPVTVSDWSSTALSMKSNVSYVLVWDILLWQVVPLYPGAHSQVPSSGEQEAPFLQLQGREQLGPQRPSAQTLSQWIPAQTHRHKYLTCDTAAQHSRNVVSSSFRAAATHCVGAAAPYCLCAFFCWLAADFCLSAAALSHRRVAATLSAA